MGEEQGGRDLVTAEACGLGPPPIRRWPAWRGATTVEAWRHLPSGRRCAGCPASTRSCPVAGPAHRRQLQRCRRHCSRGWRSVRRIRRGAGYRRRRQPGVPRSRAAPARRAAQTHSPAVPSADPSTSDHPPGLAAREALQAGRQIHTAASALALLDFLRGRNRQLELAPLAAKSYGILKLAKSSGASQPSRLRRSRLWLPNGRWTIGEDASS
jgi:hypothetical protein